MGDVPLALVLIWTSKWAGRRWKGGKETETETENEEGALIRTDLYIYVCIIIIITMSTRNATCILKLLFFITV